MRSKPSTCAGCPCHSHGSDFSRVTGYGGLGVMIVAEASGEHEARTGTPLVEYAPAGSLLERTFKRMGVCRDQFFLTNTLRCRPRNNWLHKSPWEYEALSHCRPNLEDAIKSHRPRAISSLGEIPMRELTGMVGDSRTISHLCGYVLPGPLNIPVIPAYHPAFIRRGKAAYQGFFARNLMRAINVASGRDTSFIWDLETAQHDGRLKYITRPGLDDAWSFYLRAKGNQSLTISYDIETGESASLDEDARDGFVDTRITLIQFSLGAGTGIAFPWTPEYAAIARDILHLPNVKCGHNVWLFDNKVLQAAGAREALDLNPRGTVHDTLQMFHHWQPDLPAHLQFACQWVQFPFPWKHLAATNIEFYGCVDVDATHRLHSFLLEALKHDGIWDGPTGDEGYVGQMETVRPILAGMERRGLPIDNFERLKLDGEFDLIQQEVGRELDARFPDEARSIHPKQGYKKTPKDTTGLVLRQFDIGSLDESGEPVVERVERWCRLEPFLPNSGQQLIRYMKAKRHAVPKSKETDHDGNDKDTTAKKDLQRLAKKTGDNFYLKVIEYRELGKIRSTYIEGFKPHHDGMVHTTFTFDTGIGQLSSRNPNIQNFPKHGRLAKPTRRIVAAHKGNILVEWDYKSCHVITLGFLAEDANYIRCGRIDMHSIVTGHKLGLWDARALLRDHSDDEIRAKCKWLKSNPEWKHIRDARMKHAILGIGNGLKAKGLYEKHMEDFKNQKEAAEFLATAEYLFPKVFEWQKKVQDLAHAQRFLKTQYGHIRRFYEVYRWDPKKGDYGHGDQSEEAISYWLSNIAFGYIREHMKILEAVGLNEKYGLCNNVHDSLLFHFPADLLSEHVAEIYPLLIRPSRILSHPVIAPEGLWIDVEANAGPNWSDMHEVNIKEILSDRERRAGKGVEDGRVGQEACTEVHSGGSGCNAEALGANA